MYAHTHLRHRVLKNMLWRDRLEEHTQATRDTEDFPTSNRDQNVRKHHTIIYITNFIAKEERKGTVLNVYQ